MATDYDKIADILRQRQIDWNNGDCAIETNGAKFSFSPKGDLLYCGEGDEANFIEELQGRLSEAKRALEVASKKWGLSDDQQQELDEIIEGLEW